jgi:hypothetical protein
MRQHQRDYLRMDSDQPKHSQYHIHDQKHQSRTSQIDIMEDSVRKTTKLVDCLMEYPAYENDQPKHHQSDLHADSTCRRQQ